MVVIRSCSVRSWLVGLGFLAWFASTASATTLSYTTDLKLWLKADAGVTADGSGNVTQWNDSSGNGHDGTVSNTAPNVIPGALNSLPVVRFNGASDSLVLGGGAVQSSSNFTIFAVANSTATGGGLREIYSNWDFTNNVTSVFLGVIANSASDQPVRLTDSYNTIGNPLLIPATHFRLKGVYDATAGTASVYQNEGLLGSPGVATSRDLTTTSYVGVQGALNSEFWNGDIAEILIYDHVLSAGDTAAVESYLTEKWFTVVPEPSTLALAGLGLIALVGRGLRRRWA